LVASAWNIVKQKTLIRSWRKLIPCNNEDYEFSGFEGFNDDEITTAKLAEIANQVSGSKQVDEENITEWLDCGACEPGFEMLNNDDIVRKAGEKRSMTAKVRGKGRV
jgi:hypothetical protein